MDLKHILVGTDLSENSKQAVAAAGDLARKYGAKVTLAHVYDPAPLVPPAVIPSPSKMEAAIEAELRDAVAKALRELDRGPLAGVEVQTEMLKDASPAKGLVDLAEKTGADLIVVGTHGRTGLAHMFIGSVAERVARHAHCAVLVVRGAR